MPTTPGQPEDSRRDAWTAIRSGWRGRCPVCGARSLFTAYLKMADACASCGLDLESFRADDAPAYLTIFAVGHVVIPLMLMVERAYQPDVWLHAALWGPLALGLSLWLLPRIKGATIALLWSLRFKPE